MPIQRIFIPLLVIALLLSGCGGAATATPTQQAIFNPVALSGGEANTLAATRAALPAYTASFLIDFKGAANWKYQVQERKTATMNEVNLHIEGPESLNNPGDVRIVTDGSTTWMTGPGTDNECVMFPNGQNMDPTLIYPENLLPMQDLLNKMIFEKDDTVAGSPSRHYKGNAISLGDWKDAQVEVWQDKESGALLQFAMLANGEDKLLGFGQGSIFAHYRVESLEPPTIEPVPGCEIAVPLPESAAGVVRLPGLASFESADPVDKLLDFYATALPQEGWAVSEPPAQSESSMVLSYRRGAEDVQIQLEPAESGGSKVKLLFMAAQ